MNDEHSRSPCTPESHSELEVGAAIAAGAWVCRTCARKLGVPFRYPESPWTYCVCGCALSVEEQMVALARLRSHRQSHEPLAPAPETPAENQPPLMTISQVASYFGKSEQAVYKMVERAQLPGLTRVGRRIYIRRSDLLRFFAEGRVPSPRSR